MTTKLTTVFFVAFFIKKLHNLTALSFFKRISNLSKADMSNHDMKLRAILCWSINNNESYVSALSKGLQGKIVVEGKRVDKKFKFICFKCHTETEKQWRNIMNGQWCTLSCSSNVKSKIKLSKPEIISRAEKCWNVEMNKCEFKIEKMNNKINCKFVCNSCNHQFNMLWGNVVKGSWCAICAGKVVCGDPLCQSPLCTPTTMASLDLKKLNLSWIDETAIHTVKLGSGQKCKFQCLKCNHEFMKQPCDIKKGEKCGYCYGNLLCDDKTCQFCHNNSAITIIERDDLNVLSHTECQLRKLKRGSEEILLCKCLKKGHIWEARPINLLKHNTSCPVCPYKTESLVYEYISSSHKVQIISQKKFQWARDIKVLEFDLWFVINDVNIICEIDGFSHDKDHKLTQHWNIDTDRYLKRDQIKIDGAIENGFCIMRLHQDAVLQAFKSDSCEWQTAIDNAIEACVKSSEPLNMGYVF
tara:strand:+ start:214 stop:1623 length:1410 start_codon:yes stop_codon:yes gene_type:complete